MEKSKIRNIRLEFIDRYDWQSHEVTGAVSTAHGILPHDFYIGEEMPIDAAGEVLGFASSMDEQRGVMLYGQVKVLGPNPPLELGRKPLWLRYLLPGRTAVIGGHKGCTVSMGHGVRSEEWGEDPHRMQSSYKIVRYQCKGMEAGSCMAFLKPE